MWLGFSAFVLFMMAMDLGVFHRKAHVVSMREALGWSIVWVAFALVFGAGVWSSFGSQKAMEFFTGYVVEKTLSIDNIFVFVLIFSTLGTPAIHQHRILFWGILSALVMRAGMILGGAYLLERFHWLIYVFGGFLVFTGIRLLLHRGGDNDTPGGGLLAFLRRVLPTTENDHGGRFLVREGGRLLATPLLVALILVEATDVIFAVDSIPAIFAITRDPFIVFTSNIFAILGLRSLYFLLAGMLENFRHLKPGLAAVLVFVGVKMLVVEYYKIPPMLSLAVICSILGVAIAASLLDRRPISVPRLPEPRAEGPGAS